MLPIITQFVESKIAWYISLVIMVLLGSSMAVINSSLIGFAGMLPMKYMSALMLGISLNGVLILGIRVLTLFVFDIMNPVKYFFGALIFFLIASSYSLICSFGIFKVLRSNLVIFSFANTLDDRED
jgi:hypothetical protein